MDFSQLSPAPKQAVGVYVPYYNQQNKRSVLPFAISLYQKGAVEGERRIEGGESVPFVASWFVSALPSDITRCRLQFDGNSELDYEITLANHEFIEFLIDLLINHKRIKITDFPQSFYRRLLQYEDA
jgi:hypothetical protein